MYHHVLLQILLGGMGFSRILIHVIVSLSFTQCSIMSHARTFHSSYCPDREVAKEAGQVDIFYLCYACFLFLPYPDISDTS